jgi:hypothetical protein
MGTTRYTEEIHFYEGDDRPEDRRAREDFQGAMAALLADPVYEELACPAEDPTAALAAMDWERRVRVVQLLSSALTRVRTVTPEQAKDIPDDRVRRI